MGYTRRRSLLPLSAGLGEIMSILQPDNPIPTTVSRPGKPRPLRVPALKSSTKDGKQYHREIVAMLTGDDHRPYLVMNYR